MAECCFRLKMLAQVDGDVGIGGGLKAIEVTELSTGRSKKLNFTGGGPGLGLHLGVSTGGSEVCCDAENCPSLDNFSGSGNLSFGNLTVFLGFGYVSVNFDNVGDCGPMSFSFMVGNIGLGVGFGKHWGSFNSQ